MADTVKKVKAPVKPKSPTAKKKDVVEKLTATKAPAKPRIVAAKKKAVLEAPSKSVPAAVKSAPANAKPAPSTREIAELAHKYWAERGGHHGSHEQDWLRAERELRGKAS